MHLSAIPDRRPSKFSFFFFNDTATTEIYTLSLHDALPISWERESVAPQLRRDPLRGNTWASTSLDRKSTRLNSSHSQISYAVFCLKKKKKQQTTPRLRIDTYNTHVARFDVDRTPAVIRARA